MNTLSRSLVATYCEPTLYAAAGWVNMQLVFDFAESQKYYESGIPPEKISINVPSAVIGQRNREDHGPREKTMKKLCARTLGPSPKLALDIPVQTIKRVLVERGLRKWMAMGCTWLRKNIGQGRLTCITTHEHRTEETGSRRCTWTDELAVKLGTCRGR